MHLRVLQRGRRVDRDDLARARPGERRTAPCSIPGSCTSSTKRPWPRMKRASSLRARPSPNAAHVSPFASKTATLTVLQRPHLIRTRLVICSSPIAAASTLPHSTHT